MKLTKLLFLLLISIFSLDSYCEMIKSRTPSTLIAKESDEIKISIDNTKIKRVVIRIRNLIDEESIIYRSSYINGAENIENEIGPKEFRTYTLDARITNDNTAMRPDKKTIVLETSNIDQLYFKVEKGEIEIFTSEEGKMI